MHEVVALRSDCIYMPELILGCGDKEQKEEGERIMRDKVNTGLGKERNLI